MPAVPAQERLVRPLYWKEEPESRPIIRATYFVRSGNGWLPSAEKDAEALEVRGTDVPPCFWRSNERLNAGGDWVLLSYVDSCR